jgi:hypothetical protein
MAVEFKHETRERQKYQTLYIILSHEVILADGFVVGDRWPL